MSNASDLLTKSSYCRNSKHAKCSTEGCGCKCHAPVDVIPEDAAADAEAAANEPVSNYPGDATDAEKLIADRLDPAKAPAPAKPKREAKAPKPVVKGTVDGKLTNAHKRAIRTQMVTYLAAMPVDLTGDLEGVTPQEAGAYVDTYWIKYIDPARDKARHADK